MGAGFTLRDGRGFPGGSHFGVGKRTFDTSASAATASGAFLRVGGQRAGGVVTTARGRWHVRAAAPADEKKARSFGRRLPLLAPGIDRNTRRAAVPIQNGTWGACGLRPSAQPTAPRGNSQCAHIRGQRGAEGASGPVVACRSKKRGGLSERSVGARGQWPGIRWRPAGRCRPREENRAIGRGGRSCPDVW